METVIELYPPISSGTQESHLFDRDIAGHELGDRVTFGSK